MKITRPFVYWVLVILFIWSVGKDFQLVITHQRSVDYYIFSLHDQTNLFFGFLAVTLLVDLAASYCIVRPSPSGFWICLCALALGLVYNVVSMALALSDLAGVRSAYVAGRELRGFPVNPDAADRIFTQAGMQATVGLTVVMTLVAAVLLVSQKWRFDPGQP